MAREYMVMMNKGDGKWWRAHVNCRNARITRTYEDAVQEMQRVAHGRARYGYTADTYKIVSREVTDWVDE